MRSPDTLRSSVASAATVVGVSAAAGILCSLIALRSSVIVFITAGVLCLSFAMMHWSIGVFNLRAMTIPTFWYWVYVVAVLVPGLFVFPDHPDPYRTQYLIGIESVTITVPLGVWLTNLSCGFRKDEIRAYLRKPVLRTGDNPQFLAAFLGLLGLAVVLSVLYLAQVQTVPLYDLIAHPGAYDMLVHAREESLKLMDSHFVYAYAVLRSTIYPLLILIALGMYLTTRRGAWGALLVASAGAGLLYNSLTIAKAPVSSLVVVAALFYYLYRGGRVRILSIGPVVALALVFPVFVILMEQAGSVGLVTALQGIGDRLFHLPAEILYYYFRIFPDIAPHQHGATIDKLAWLMGVKTFDDANFVGRYMMSLGAGFRSTVTANAPFLGSLYTDFGLPGVFVGGFLAGVIMQTLQIYILRRPKTVLNLALFAFLLFDFCLLNATTLPVVLLSDGALLSVALIWMMKRIDPQPARRLVVKRMAHRASIPA